MRYIKTYELTQNEIKEEQECILALLKFGSKLSHIYKEYFGVSAQLQEESGSGANPYKGYYWLLNKNRSDELTLFNVLIKKNWKNDYIISFYFNPKFTEMNEFINDLFKTKMTKSSTRYYRKDIGYNDSDNIKYCTREELIKYSDEILDKFELFHAIKKYNL
jgi:hypothetical protein